MDRVHSPIPLFNFLCLTLCKYGRPLLRECSIKLLLSKHSQLKLVRLFCDGWRCQWRKLRYRDANIKIRYDAKLPNLLYWLYGRPLLRESSIKLLLSKHSLLKLVCLFCNGWRCQWRKLRYRDANIKIRYDAKLPYSLYAGHA